MSESLWWCEWWMIFYLCHWLPRNMQGIFELAAQGLSEAKCLFGNLFRSSWPQLLVCNVTVSHFVLISLVTLMLKPFASTLGTRPPHHSVAPLTAPIMVKFYVSEEGFRPEFRFMWLSYYSKARFLKSISGGSFLGVLGNGKPGKLQFLSVPCLFLHSNYKL